MVPPGANRTNADLEAPILAKPSGAEDVVSRLFGLSGQFEPA